MNHYGKSMSDKGHLNGHSEISSGEHLGDSASVFTCLV